MDNSKKKDTRQKDDNGYVFELEGVKRNKIRDSQLFLPKSANNQTNSPPLSPKTHKKSQKGRNLKISLVLLTALLLLIFVTSGTAIDYDLIQGIATPIYSLYNIKPSTLLSIQSAYGFINIFFDPIVGYLVSYLGVATATTIFSGFIFIGIFIAYLSTLNYNFLWVQIGYFMIAPANEGLIVSQMTGLEKWFSGKFLSLSVGIKFSIFMLTGALGEYFCPLVYIRTRNLQTPFFLAALITFFGFLMSFIYYLAEPGMERVLKDHEADLKRYQADKKGMTNQNGLNSSDLENEEWSDALKNQGLSNRNRLENRNAIELRNRQDKGSDGSEGVGRTVNSRKSNFGNSGPKSQSHPKEWKFKFSDVKKLGILYWLTVGVFSFTPQIYFTMLATSTDLVHRRFNFEYEKAKNFIVIMKVTIFVLLPPVSYTVVRIGKKGLLLCLASLISILSLLNLYSFTTQNSLRVSASMAGLGVFYAIYTSCLWSSMALTMPRAAVGFGYGIASCIQSIVLGGFSFIFGEVINKRTKQAYGNGLLAMILVGGIGFGFCLALFMLDWRAGGVLHLAENDEAVLEYRRLLNQKYVDDDS